VTGYRLDGYSNPGRNTGIFPFATMLTMAPGLTHSHIRLLLMAHSFEVKQAEHEADYPSSCNARVYNAWILNIHASYGVSILRSRDKFTLHDSTVAVCSVSW